jgi:hypothetical protein
LSFWLKRGANPSSQPVGQLADGCAFFGDASNLYFANNSSAAVQIQAVITPGVFNHIVVTRSANLFAIWSNGVLRSTQTANVTSSSTGMQIGTGEACDIDAFAIFGRALTDSEIAALYNDGAALEL